MNFVMINGQRFVSDVNGNVIITSRGDVVIGEKKVLENLPSPVKVIIEGSIQNFECHGDAEVHGDVTNLKAGNNVKCNNVRNAKANNNIEVLGDVSGDVEAGNNVEVQQTVTGNVRATNSVKANIIAGNVTAGNKITYNGK